MAICPSCMSKFEDSVLACPHDGASLVPEETFRYVDKDLAVGDTVGEYRIQGKIGEGGFGAVYAAVHPVIGKAAAIKVLSRQFSANPQMVSRFLAEARAVNQIRHRNIIDIFSFGQLPDGRQYYVMELLDGAPFDKYMHQLGRLSFGQALPILRGVARALDAAHAKDILHRDLKPENIFLVFDEDGAVSPKLLDFGLVKLLSHEAKAAGEHKTKTGTPMGTPYYMSPEQCRGVDVDQRTDIYAFGAVVFQVLTGKLLFDGESSMDILLKHVTVEPPKASNVNDAVPDAFDAPLAAMLAKDPDARPSSVGQALESLVGAATAAGIPNEGVTLPPPDKAIASGPLPLAPLATGSGDTLAADAAGASGSEPVKVITGPQSGEARRRPAPGAPAGGPGSSFVTAETDVRLAGSPTRSRMVPFIAVAVLGLALGIGAVVTFARSGPNAGVNAAGSGGGATTSAKAASNAPATSTATATLASATTTLASASSASPPAATVVRVRVEGAPPGATVRSAAGELGPAPGPFAIPAGSETTLTIAAKGYKPKDVAVSPTADTSLHVALEKSAAGTPPGAAGTGKKNNGVPLPSDLADPEFDKHK